LIFVRYSNLYVQKIYIRTCMNVFYGIYVGNVSIVLFATLGVLGSFFAFKLKN